MGKNLAVLSCVASMAAALCGAPKAHAGKLPLLASFDAQDGVQVRFDPQAGQTRVAGRAGSSQCFSFTLPQEWRSITGGMEARLKSTFSDAELVVGLRSSNELRGLPQPDLASRDAALLQQDYENRLGRPAQSVAVASFAQGATRWSATWVDAHLPGGPMTIETFIVPLSNDWVLELSVSNVDAKEAYDALVHGLLTGLRVQQGSGCASRAAF